VKNSAFVDTFFLIALLETSDAHHKRARALSKSLGKTKLLTTDAVLIELGNYFARSSLRVEAIEWIRAIRAHAEWEVVPLDAALVARGEDRYRRYSDKSWSLTDCISMEVMKQRGLREVATSDGHFTQAGFQILIK